MNEKLLTSELFKGRKDSYKDSVKVEFKWDRLTDSEFYKSLPKPKQDLLAQVKTKCIQDPANEKIMVGRTVASLLSLNFGIK
jgi:hypothetical protein